MAQGAVILGILLRTDRTLDICDFLFRRLVMNTALILVKALHVWDNFAGNLLGVLAAHVNQTCMVRVAQPLPRARCGGRHQTFGLSIGAASRPHFARLERRRTDSRTTSFLPCSRARDAFESALLGDVELRSSKSRAPRLRAALDGLAVEQRGVVSGPNRCERGGACLAGVSAARLRQELG